MRCGQCHAEDTKVIESRDVSEGEAVRRRRMCSKCLHRFTTYERLERPQIVVIKNNGNRELFYREKIISGLYRACEKTPVTSLQIEKLVSNIETNLADSGEQEHTSSSIGEMVMERLALLNDVAYVRFASVYRRFKNIAGFEQQLIEITKKRQKLKPSSSVKRVN